MPKIISNKNVKGPYYKIVIQAAEIARIAKPGQFLQVKVNNTCDPLLRRPLSIHKVRSYELGARREIEIIYEVVGKGTEILSQRKPGEELDVIGPLGNGFSLRTTHDARRTTILIAGGIGGAPLVFLAQKLKKYKPLVLIGANTKNRILCQEEFEALGCEVKVATDDGSSGFKGRVTELLNNILRTTHHALRTTIYACGPLPMLRGISKIIKGKNIFCQASLDENMACGIGACLGCMVKTKSGYKRVCKDGPVFDIKDLML